MSSEKILPNIVSDYKQHHMYPIMSEFYDVDNPSEDVARRFIQALDTYVEFINTKTPYSLLPGLYDVPDRTQFMPVIAEEVQWAQSEAARIWNDCSLPE